MTCRELLGQSSLGDLTCQGGGVAVAHKLREQSKTGKERASPLPLRSDCWHSQTEMTVGSPDWGSLWPDASVRMYLRPQVAMVRTTGPSACPFSVR